MNDKIEISRDLIERTLPCIYKSEKRGAQVAKELRAALSEQPVNGTRKTTKQAFESMSQKDWELVLEKGTNLQLLSLVKSYKKIIGRYQNMCGELYQVLSALDAPVYVLDRVLNASESMVITSTPSLLPFDKHAWPIKQSVVLPEREEGEPYWSGELDADFDQRLEWAEAKGFNRAIDKVKELNQ